MSNRKDNQKCKIVQDLLPLYEDQVCSDASKAMVAAHLAECSDCRQIAESLKNTGFEDRLTAEKDGVLKAHAKQERKAAVTVGMWTAGILMVPLIVCLICNLAIGHGLDWFFIVFAALLVFASFTVVPMVVQHRKALWTLGCFTLTLLLLLLVTNIYSGGSWFFLAAIPILFGMSVIFMPYVITQLSLPKPLTHCKGLLVMALDTILLYALIIVCGFSASSADYWPAALKITSVFVLLPWLLFAVIRYLKLNGFIKGGISMVIIGFYSAFANQIISWFLNTPPQGTLAEANLSYWGNNITINSNVDLLLLLSFLVVGVILIIVGVVRQYQKK